MTATRPNVYFRVARRGFGSCVHPPCLDSHLSMNDVSLVAWFPTLGRRDETALHRLDAQRYGEFHRETELASLLEEARRRGGAEASVSQADMEVAREWAAGARRTVPRTSVHRKRRRPRAIPHVCAKM